MKRLFGVRWVASLTLLASLLLGCSMVWGQQLDAMLKTPLPTDPNVRIGQLENGMTYYIRANREPRNRAEFYIVHHVGAILEEDSQNGLAHFTEHMAFNGTKHFPGKNLLHFLEKNGVKFGADVNAFTTTDMTCYNISDVPTTRKGLMDSCMMILADWSGDISFDHAEIDNERGVIQEEYRTRRNANWRAAEAKNKVLYKGSKYAERDVIGSLDLLKTFEYQTIKDFYHKWYRPDLQAIIVVGDFDVDEMEARVRNIAGAVKAHANPTPKQEYAIPQAEGIEYASFSDEEMPLARIELTYKLPPDAKKPKTIEFYRERLTRQLVISMLNSRLSELTQRPNAPFAAGFCGYANIVEPLDVFIAIGVANPGAIQNTLKAIATEMQRAVQHGFLASELVRAKQDKLRNAQSVYDEREKMSNSDYIFDYIDHFTAGSPILGAELDLQMTNALCQTIEVADVNAMVRSLMPSRDLLIYIAAPEGEKDAIPSQEQATALFNSVCDSTLDPWEDNEKNEPLIAELPKPGTIKKIKKEKKFGSETWTLSNGVKVVVKPTDYREDEVIMRGFAEGGESLVADEDVYSSQLAGSVATLSGVGNFNAIELEKLLAGKNVSVSPHIASSRATIEGSSAAKIEELECLLQLTHLYFTQPRFDEGAYNNFVERLHTVLVNQEKVPDALFGRRLTGELTQDAERAKPLSSESLKKMSLERMEAIYREQFSNAGNFTFVFVGNINPEQLKPLVNLYLGSLPTGTKLSWKDNGVRFPEKTRKLDFNVKMETPKTRVAVVYQGKASYDAPTQLALEAFEHVLDLRYTAEVREKEGGTYGVRTDASLTRRPEQAARIYALFDTEPSKANKLIPMIHDILQDALKAISQEDIDKAKQHFLKSYEERVRTNNYWVSVLSNYEQTGIDTYSDYKKQVESLTPSKLADAMQKIFRGAPYVEVVMRGYNQ